MPFDLIIWDCDGVLVDSEVIACGIIAEAYTSYGYPMSTQDFMDRFAGRMLADSFSVLEQETGKDFSKLFDLPTIRQTQLQALQEKLRPDEVLIEVLNRLNLPMCVASGSAPDRVTLSLAAVGILERFEGKIYSSSQVANSKPAPDVFLYAAAQMGALPSKCLVIEDSVSGVTAGKAAGMSVFAYMGGSHITPAWRDRIAVLAPDVIFEDMWQLPAYMQSFGKNESKVKC